MIQSECMHELDSHDIFTIIHPFSPRIAVIPVASEMGLINFTFFSAKLLNILSWPPLPLLYPMFFSIWAIESDSECSYEQCLKYWILFCITSICESMIALLLPWLPFWPYVRGTAFLLLAVPDFGGASYVYKNFIRPYTKLNSEVGEETLLIPEGRCNLLIEEDELFTETRREIENERERTISYEGDLSSSMLTIQSPVTWSGRPNRSQRDWSCAICLVSTDSQKSLMQHLHGKKHKLKEEELRYVDVMAIETVINSSQSIRSNNMDLVESISQITRENFWRLITPSTRQYKWCVWTKPEYGWLKLNTDGSVDKRNASFGGLLRDFNGEPICGYVSKTSTKDIFLAELWAIWRGLVLASSLGLKLIWVESDSMSVVKTINKKQHYGHKAGSYLEDIWKLLGKFDKYKVSHSFRESNKAADYLSRMDLLGFDVVLWPVDFPDNLWDIIKDDARGKQYFRA